MSNKNKKKYPSTDGTTHSLCSTTTQTNCDTIVYDGTTYRVPHVDRAHDSITYLAIRTRHDYLTICDSGTDEPPYYEACDDQSVAIYLSTGSDSNYAVTTQPLFMTLFKVGYKQAIASCRARYDTLFESHFSSKKSILSAGDYLLVISGVCESRHAGMTCCGYHTIYPFHVLTPQHETPALCVTAQAVTTGNTPFATRRDIAIELTFDADYNAHSLYHITCIDSNYRRVGAVDYYMRYCKKGQKQTFEFRPENFWSGNGHYTLIMAQGDTFVTTVPLAFVDAPALPADSFSDKNIFRAIAQIEMRDNMSFLCFNRLSGLSGIRKQIFALYYKRMLYKELKENGIADYTTHASNIVVADDNYTQSQCADTITRIVGTPRGSIIEVDLATSTTNENDNIWHDHNKTFPSFEEENATYILYNLFATFSASGRALVSKLRKYLRKGHQIVLSGTRAETEHLFEVYPELEPYFTPEYRFTVGSYDIDDILYAIATYLQGRGNIRLDDSAITRLHAYFTEHLTSGTLPDFTPDKLQKYAAGLENKLHQRLQSMEIADIKAHPEVACSITAAEADPQDLCHGNNIVEECLIELRQMTGLHAMKRAIESIATRIMWEQKCRRLGLSTTPAVSPHMIFTGNPGTGKTTVAQMTGRIFHALGLLSKGEVIVTERSRLVGRYIGETERNMQELLQQARGNVLFIDEAYTLCDTTQDRKDFGYRVIESLLTTLATKHNNLIVILAGYEKEMERLINSNEGLRGRFPHIIPFDDYTADELMQIGCRFVQKRACCITDEAIDALREIVTETVAHRDRHFSNARWMEQLIEAHILPAMAQRTLKENSLCDPAYYRTIEAVDIATARTSLNILDNSQPVRYSIGFRA